MKRRRLVADRFRRIWTIVEAIAQEPGCSRRELAERFALSERQLQADLNVIRSDMALPLVRRQGYRFEPEELGPESRFGLGDAHLLALALAHLAADGSVPREAVGSLAAKLPGVFPLHLRGLLRQVLAATVGDCQGEPGYRVFAVLAEAMRGGTPVRLHYQLDFASGGALRPIVRPELVIPYLGCWYLIGECYQPRKTMMFPLDAVAEVTHAPEGRRSDEEQANR
jgi:predicted DNA-binding transcriptional regulator YafY